MLGGEARDRIAGFWRALGLLPPKEPDHLAALLSLYASTIEAELAEVDPARRLLWTQSRKALLWEHLLSWLPAYLDKLAQVAPPYYARWAEVLEQSLVAEAAMLGRQDRLSLHLRASPGSTPTRGREFVAWLLAPVRSGIVLVRSDLERAASELKLGLRIGERRWVLQSLLSQEPACTLTWLAAETQRWAALHERWTPVTGDFAWFWWGRARAAEDLLLAAVPVASPSTR
jgi:hypothetical protein